MIMCQKLLNKKSTNYTCIQMQIKMDAIHVLNKNTNYKPTWLKTPLYRDRFLLLIPQAFRAGIAQLPNGIIEVFR